MTDTTIISIVGPARTGAMCLELDCRWSRNAMLNGGPTQRRRVRRQAGAHARKTGHTVQINTTTATRIRVAGGP